jgi:hypothetical protein
MNQGLLQELKKLRNEIAHGQRHANADSLGKRLTELSISVPAEDLQWFAADLLRGLSNMGEHFVPPALLSVIRLLLDSRAAAVSCDPWAGLGVLAATVREAVQARKTIACMPNPQSIALGQVLAPQLDWHAGDPLAFLETLTDPLDVIASVLPFGLRDSRAVELRGESGELVRCTGDLGSLLLAAASSRLSPEGLGIFVVTPSFFSSRGPCCTICLDLALA